MTRQTVQILILFCLILMAAVSLSVGLDLGDCREPPSRPLFQIIYECTELSLNVDRFLYGPKHPLTARKLAILAGYKSMLGDESGAATLSTEVLRICRASCKPESKRLFEALSRCGRLLPDNRDAINALRQAVKIGYRQAFTSDFSPADIAAAEETLGDLLGCCGEAQEQLLRYERAYDWRLLNESAQELTRDYTPDYGSEAYLLESMALCRQEGGQGRQADFLLSQAESLAKKCTDKPPVYYWTCKGEITLLKGAYAEAETYFRKALSRCEKALPADFALSARNGIARSLLFQKKLPEAESLVREILSSAEAAGRRLYLAGTRALLADILMEQKKTGECLGLLQKAEPEMDRQMPWNDETLKMYELYARVLADLKDTSAAAQKQAKAEAIRVHRRQETSAKIRGALAASEVFLVPYPKDVHLLDAAIERLDKELASDENKKGLAAAVLCRNLVDSADLISAREDAAKRDLRQGEEKYRSSYSTAAESNTEAGAASEDEPASGDSPDSEKKPDSQEKLGSESLPVAEAQSEDLPEDEGYETAQPRYERAAVALEKDPAQSRLYLRCLIGLGRCQVNFAENRKAQETFSRALKLSRKIPGAELFTARLLEYLSETDPGNCKDALAFKKYRFDLLKQSLAIYRMKLGSVSSKVTDILFRLAELSWYIPDASPSGSELLRQAYACQSDVFERDLNAFGPVHPQIIEDLEKARGKRGSFEKGCCRVAIWGLFFGENDLDFASEMEKLSTFDGLPFSPEAAMVAHFNCLVPIFILLCGLLLFTLVRLPASRKAGEAKAVFSLVTLAVFLGTTAAILLVLPDPTGTPLGDAPLEQDLRLLKRVLSVYEKSSEFNSACQTMGRLGTLCMRLRRYGEAEDFFKRAEASSARSQDLPVNFVYEVRRNHVALLKFLNRHKEAKAVEALNEKTEKDRERKEEK
jgi:hypothetical protein